MEISSKKIKAAFAAFNPGFKTNNYHFFIYHYNNICVKYKGLIIRNRAGKGFFTLSCFIVTGVAPVFLVHKPTSLLLD